MSTHSGFQNSDANPALPQGEITPCSLIVDKTARSGAENMALDEVLLDSALNSHECALRIYSWNQPTVTLGYFQRSDQQLADPLQQLPRIRRLTGGGAILHHHEITYSLVVPPSHEKRHNPSLLYGTIHRAIVQLLAQSGCSAALRGDSANEVQLSEAEPYLCFLRQDPNDIVCRPRNVPGRAAELEPNQTLYAAAIKIVGSAQRRRKGAVLQHGSILLRQSHLTPGMAGICDIFPQFDLSKFLSELPAELATQLSTRVIEREFCSSELELADKIKQSRKT